ncbi:glycosyltransferase family 4 protein [Candidatus Margulisiibacteriota bacterium]
MIKIAVDASVLSSKIILNTGIYYCLLNYLEQLQSNNNGQYELILFVPEFIKDYFVEKYPKLTVQTIRFPLNNVFLRIFYQNIILPIYLYINRIDIYFNPSIIVPFLCFKKSIIVIHDLTYKLYPAFYKSRVHNFYLRVMTWISIKKASYILCVSENTKSDVLRIYNPDTNKVKTITNGLVKHEPDQSASKRISPMTPENNLISSPYVLFVGTFEKKKNIPCLLKAFDMVRQSEYNNLFLVLAGKDGWGCGDVYKTIDELQLEDHVIIKKELADRELDQIYTGASIFVLPSVYEGFGLPVLEAMDHGVPVIASNAASLPEIVGDAGLLFESNNAEELAEKIIMLLKNNDLQVELRERGYQNLKRFTWELFGREFYKLLL